jgi:hypothetical protein
MAGDRVVYFLVVTGAIVPTLFTTHCTHIYPIIITGDAGKYVSDSDQPYQSPGTGP